MDKNYMSPEEAAPLLGISPADIRKFMRSGALDLGLALDPKKTGLRNWRFKIYPDKVRKIRGDEPIKEEDKNE